MSFEIKDLVGLKEPLIRLIDVLAAGAGQFWRFSFGKTIAHREGQAAADKILQISSAVSRAQEQATLVRYKDDKLEIVPAPLSERPPLTLAERANARAEFIAEKQQQNIEMIAAHAALQLADKQSVPSEKPDEDWIARFFAIAQDISSPQMQELWGRILAGEIERPGAFSLRTLDFVRNLTKADAALIQRLAEVAVGGPNESFVHFADESWYQDTKKLIPSDLIALGELGVIFQTRVTITYWNNDPQQAISLFLPERKLLILQPDTKSGPLRLEVWKVTKLGIELLPISQPAFDIEFARFLGRQFRWHGRKSSLKEILVVEGNKISFRTIEDL